MTRQFVNIAALTVLLAGSLSCVLFRPGPAATVKKFYLHMDKGELDEGIHLLSIQIRSQMGDQKLRIALAEAARTIKQQKQGIKSIEVVSEDIQGQIATSTLLITYGNGARERDVSKLVKERDEWKIAMSK